MKRNNPYDLRKIWEQIELDLVKSLKRNLKRHEAEEKKEGLKWEQWQSAKLRNIREYHKENKKIISDQSKAVKKIVSDSIEESYKRGQNLFQRISDRITSRFARKGTLTIPADARKTKENIPFEKQIRKEEQDFFRVNDEKIQALEKTVCNDLRKAQTAVLRKMDDVYRQTIYKAEMHMAAGAKTLDQAIDMVTKEFLEKGINCIEYRDGKRVNVASYAEMALRTASHRATLLGEGKKRDEWGIHTVVVSAHANTCPRCEHWQGMILIDDVFSSGTLEEALAGHYYLLSFAIQAGLLHPNCRHTISTYFPGITELPVVPDGKEAVKKYEAEQEQRRLERLIRKWKRIAEGVQDGDNLNYAKKVVRHHQSELKKHLEKHLSLRRDYTREKTRGIPHQPKSYKETGGKYERGTAEWNLRRDDEAEEYYSRIRSSNADTGRIAKNIGWSERSIARIKQHIFYDSHTLDYGKGRFDPDYNMAVAWQRLLDGKALDRDILLLKHEKLESILEKKYNLTYREAHDRATLKHDWNSVLEKEVGDYGENDDLHGLIGKD